MKKNYCKYFFLLYLIIAQYTSAQQVKPGGHWNGFQSLQLLNEKDSLLISGAKNKGIVLSFWNTTCLSCIHSFPKLEALQKQFGNRLQIIMLNRESKDSTLAFFSKHKQVKPPALPMITAAGSYWFQFSADRTPYHVWIDSAGTVQYITEPYNLTKEHLQAFLSGQKPAIKNNTDQWQNQQALFYTSSLTPCNENSRAGYSEGTVEENGMIHLLNPCTSIASLFQQAYSEFNRYHFSTASQVILDVPDPFALVYPTDENLIDQWKNNHRYTYELKLPAAKKQERYKIMQQDLQRYFDYEAVVEKRNMEACVLIKTETVQFINTGQQSFNRWVGKKYIADSVRCIQNLPFADFAATVKAIIETNLQLPFVDQTGIKQNISICIEGAALEPFNLAVLNKGLKKYGLAVIKKNVLVTVLVIKQKRE